MKPSFLAVLPAILLLTLFFSGCLGPDEDGGGGAGQITLTIWYTYEGMEEDVFLQSVAQFGQAHPHIEVEAVEKPFSAAEQAFVTAASGDEAPDLMRFSNDQLGYVGSIRQHGLPLLEDLRPYLTPAERERWDPRALEGMRFENGLLALPASQDCLSLFYNQEKFDSYGVDYPEADWTLDDLMAAAGELTDSEQFGLVLPIKDPYWWFGFQRGFGGLLFDANDTPTLDSAGSARALEFTVSLETEYDYVPTGMGVERMEDFFAQGDAAMIIDGPWNWAEYSGVETFTARQALLPTVDETGLPIAPMVSYKGYAISKQSAHKQEAYELALWLTSAAVQREFALTTYTMPTLRELYLDEQITANPVVSGFLAQAQRGFPAPTSQAMGYIYNFLPEAMESYYKWTTGEGEGEDREARVAEAQDRLALAQEAVMERMGQ